MPADRKKVVKFTNNSPGDPVALNRMKLNNISWLANPMGQLSAGLAAYINRGGCLRKVRRSGMAGKSTSAHPAEIHHQGTGPEAARR